MLTRSNLPSQPEAPDDQKQSPTEVEGLIERLREMAEFPNSNFRYAEHVSLITEAADALARVTAERDEARAEREDASGETTLLREEAEGARLSCQTAEAELDRTRIALEEIRHAAATHRRGNLHGTWLDGLRLIETRASEALSPLGGGGGREEVRAAQSQPCAEAGTHIPPSPYAPFSAGPVRRVRHLKRGTTYTLAFGQADAMAQCAEPIQDGDVLTVYFGEDGMIFARPTHEFYDGRFEALSAEAASPAEGPIQTLEEPLP